MKVELKRISFNERLSEETNAFVADLYINGKKVGECKNEGRGGPTDYYSDGTPESRKLIKESEDYYKSLPKYKPEGYDFELQPSLEGTIDDLLEDFLKEKDKKKFEKKMESGILFGVPNGHSYRIISWKGKKLSEIPYLQLQQTVNETRQKYCKDGVVILNTNLGKLGII